jgi:hypothetical protein
MQKVARRYLWRQNKGRRGLKRRNGRGGHDP